jgi:hypothetical protein
MEPGPEQSFTNTHKPALLTIYSTQPSSKSHSLKVDKSTRPFDIAVAWLRWYGFADNQDMQIGLQGSKHGHLQGLRIRNLRTIDVHIARDGGCRIVDGQGSAS